MRTIVNVIRHSNIECCFIVMKEIKVRKFNSILHFFGPTIEKVVERGQGAKRKQKEVLRVEGSQENKQKKFWHPIVWRALSQLSLINIKRFH